MTSRRTSRLLAALGALGLVAFSAPVATATATTSAPVVVSTTPAAGTAGGLPAGAAPVDVEISRGYLFVTNSGATSVSTINLARARSLTVAATTPQFGEPGFVAGLIDPQSISISGNYAAVSNMSGQSVAYLNIASPTRPLVTGALPDSGTPGGLPNGSYTPSSVLVGTMTYVATYGNNSDIPLIPLTNPAHPVVTSSLVMRADDYPAPTYIAPVAAQGNQLFAISGVTHGAYVIDITNRARPQQRGKVPVSGRGSLPGGLLLSMAPAPHGFLSLNTWGLLSLVDTRKPWHPFTTGTTPWPGHTGGFKPGSYLQEATVSGHYAYVTDPANELVYIVDIRNEKKPRVVYSTPTAGTPGGLAVGADPTGIAVSGDYVFVANKGTNTVSTIYFHNDSELADTGLNFGWFGYGAGALIVAGGALTLLRRREKPSS